ncbi:MAG: hypothetical protein HY513_03930 [Candidatus Aenigmarchaeota archaeon]|nr:hypothetical protein [Candidatus Aenigmarchaeota archaeon]
MACKKCGGKTKGFKCDICSATSDHHVESHKCGGKHCMPMCGACGQAEKKCKC